MYGSFRLYDQMEHQHRLHEELTAPTGCNQSMSMLLDSTAEVQTSTVCETYLTNLK
jgi:hypothetical protein